MANNDSAQYNLRYNEITGDLEAQVGLNWVTLALANASGITQLHGDVAAGPGSGNQAATLATVNSNVGSFTSANITVNAKGLITAAANGSGGGPTPNVVTVVSTGAGTNVTSATYVATELITPAITASSNTAKLSIRGLVSAQNNSSTTGFELFTSVQKDNTAANGTTANGTDVALDSRHIISSVSQDTASAIGNLFIETIVTPGDTSPHTYTIVLRLNGSYATGYTCALLGQLVAEEIH